jgi:hypothetical protein
LLRLSAHPTPHRFAKFLDATAKALSLVAKLAIKEVSHYLQRLFGLRQMNRKPMAVRHRFEHYELGLDSRPAQSAMKCYGGAQQKVACSGHQQGRRKAFQIRVNR